MEKLCESKTETLKLTAKEKLYEKSQYYASCFNIIAIIISFVPMCACLISGATIAGYILAVISILISTLSFILFFTAITLKIKIYSIKKIAGSDIVCLLVPLVSILMCILLPFLVKYW